RAGSLGNLNGLVKDHFPPRRFVAGLLPAADAQGYGSNSSILHPLGQRFRFCLLTDVFQQETKALRRRKIVTTTRCLGEVPGIDPFGEFGEDGCNVARCAGLLRRPSEM